MLVLLFSYTESDVLPMWVKRSEYNRLKDRDEMATELEKEVSRLANLISAEVKDCKVGIWCKECEHLGYDFSQTDGCSDFGFTYAKQVAGNVVYCKKHIHEICPEFEVRSNR